MAPTRETGSALAEVRARAALRGAGLDPRVPLVRASSVTNEVWLSPTHAIRVNRKPSNRLAREASLARILPPEVGYPPVVAHGGGRGEDWLVCERLPGAPLAHRWPDLERAERRSAVRSLAVHLAALHEVRPPTGIPPVESPPHALDFDVPDPTAPVADALDRARQLDHVDAGLIDEALALVHAGGAALRAHPRRSLVHSDVTFENVLWHEGAVTALLDFEWARVAPRDLELDVLLRCCAYPQLHVAVEHEARTRRADYYEVPSWLAEDYPELFTAPDLLARLRLYSVAYNARALLDLPPPAPLRRLDGAHPYARLALVVRGESHLDALLAPGA